MRIFFLCFLLLFHSLTPVFAQTSTGSTILSEMNGVISSISSTTLRPGDIVTLSGNNLGSGPTDLNQICFSENACTTSETIQLFVRNWSNTAITLQVPQWNIPSSGNIEVLLATSDGSQYWVSSPSYTFSTTVPSLVSASPKSVIPLSTLVTIQGSNFGATKHSKDRLCFGNTCLQPEYISQYVQTWSDSEITMYFPVITGAKNVPLTLYKYLYTLESTGTDMYHDLSLGTFSIETVPEPKITSVTPTQIIPGQSILTINGNGFGSRFTTGNHQICFGSLCIQSGMEYNYIESWSDTSVRFRVPDFVAQLSSPTTVSLRLLSPSKGYYSHVEYGTPLSISPIPLVSEYYTFLQFGQQYFVTGTNFGSTQGKITINGQSVPIDSWTNSRIDFHLGENISSGEFIIHTAQGALSSPLHVDILESQSSSNDPYSQYQWYMSAFGFDTIVDVRKDAAPVIVAVIDSAVDTAHEDLSKQMWSNPKEIPNNGIDDDNNGFIDDIHGWDFVRNTAKLSPRNSHGTMVASIIAAENDNFKGIAGLAPNARIMSLDATQLESDGYITMDVDAVKEAIKYAVDNGAKVINLSFGGVTNGQIYEDVFQYAYDRNVLIVAAAGNQGYNLDQTYYTPVCDDGPENFVLGIAALNEKLEKAYFSNFGLGCIDLSFPGTNMVGAVPSQFQNGGIPYSNGSGTSFAAPVLAGLSAVLIGTHPDWNVAEINEGLRQSAQSLENDTYGIQGYLGEGTINGSALKNIRKPAVAYAPSQKQELTLTKTNLSIRVEEPDTDPIDGPIKAKENTGEQKVENSSDSNQVFEDIPEFHFYKDAIAYLKGKGIVEGYEDGTFRPLNAINRAEFLKILYESRPFSIPDSRNCFSDVTDQWFAKYVCYAKAQGIVQGYPDPNLPSDQWTFRPEQTVNKAEALKIILEMFSTLPQGSFPAQEFADVTSDLWFAPYVDRASRLNIIEENGLPYFRPSEFMKRGSISEIFYRALRIEEEQLERFQ